MRSWLRRLWNRICGRHHKDVLIALLEGQTVLDLQILSLRNDIKKILAILQPPAVSIRISITGATKGANGMLQVKDDGSVVATLSAVDAKGNPGPMDAPPTWTSSDPTLATLNVAADGMSAVAVLSGKLGTFTISAQGQAGGKDLSATSDQIEIDPEAPSVLQMALAAQPAQQPSS